MGRRTIGPSPSEAVIRRWTDKAITRKKNTTNNDLQNITQKAKARATQTPLKSGGELGFSGRVCSSCSTCGTCSGNKCENIFVCLDHLLLTILLCFFSLRNTYKNQNCIPGINIDFIVIFVFRQNKYNVLLCNILPVYLVENVSCFKVF